MEPELVHFHKFLKIKKEDGKSFVFDPIRRKYLVLQPEELVRQSWIQYLINEKNINPKALQVEKKIAYSRHARRFDLVMYEREVPLILFELKGFDTPLTQAAAEQIALYNKKLNVPYLVLSNGISHAFFFVDFASNAVNKLNGFSEILK